MLNEINYLKHNYTTFFISNNKNNIVQLQQVLRKYKFIVNDNIVKKESKFILGVNVRKKTILELLYLVILTAYYCNIKDIENIEIKFSSIFNSNVNIANSLIKIFNSLQKYKTTYYKNNIKITKNILQANIEKKDEIIKKETKLILLTNYKNFLYFLKHLQQKTSNLFVKQILNNYLNKFRKRQQQKEKKQEEEIVKNILNI